MALPPPTTFAEGQRKLFGILVAAAGMFCGAMAIAMICLLMWGEWSKEHERLIIIIFGWTLGGFVASMATVIIALSVGGPVGRLKASVSKTGASLEGEGHADRVITETKTETTVVPGEGPSVT